MVVCTDWYYNKAIEVVHALIHLGIIEQQGTNKNMGRKWPRDFADDRMEDPAKGGILLE